MHFSGRRTSVPALVAAVVTVLALVTSTPPASAYSEAPEDYASYQPEKACKKKPRPGSGREGWSMRQPSAAAPST